MTDGLVSTVIPVHNRPDMLLEAVRSVLNQTYSPIEVIVVDDGSDDLRMPESLALCAAEGEGRVRIIRQQNAGPGAARQRGLEAARGEFIQFLDSDDLLYAEKFSRQIAKLRRDRSSGVAYGKTRNRGNETAGTGPRPWKRTGERIETLFPAILGGRIWDTSTPLYRAEVARLAGGWSNLINEEDWEFDARVGALGIRLAWIDDWVCEQRACASDRASEGGASNPIKLADRARARHLILASALGAGVSPDVPEFQQFIRYSFLVARQCAAAGLEAEAESLVERLNAVAPRLVMRLYLAAGRSLGFGRATALAEHGYSMLGLLRASRP